MCGQSASIRRSTGKGRAVRVQPIRKVLKIADRLIVMDQGAIIHEAKDIAAGLEFYISNCYKHLGKTERQKK
jgi:ABC-type branched-subunit amino acid transport system ATPase component